MRRQARNCVEARCLGVCWHHPSAKPAKRPCCLLTKKKHIQIDLIHALRNSRMALSLFIHAVNANVLSFACASVGFFSPSAINFVRIQKTELRAKCCIGLRWALSGCAPLESLSFSVTQPPIALVAAAPDPLWPVHRPTASLHGTPSRG